MHPPVKNTLVGLCSAAIALAFCLQLTASAKDIVYLTPGLDLPFWRYLSKGVESVAQKEGYGYQAFDSHKQKLEIGVAPTSRGARCQFARPEYHLDRRVQRVARCVRRYWPIELNEVASLRRRACIPPPRLASLPQHRRQKLAGAAARRLDDVFRRAPGDGLAAPLRRHRE